MLKLRLYKQTTGMYMVRLEIPDDRSDVHIPMVYTNRKDAKARFKQIKSALEFCGTKFTDHIDAGIYF